MPTPPSIVSHLQGPCRVAITGAGSYSGRYITSLLLDNPSIVEIRNLTNHPNRGFPLPAQHGEDDISGRQRLFQQRVNTRSLNFSYADGFCKNLAESLRGVDVFFITYWMRFFELSSLVNPALARVQELVDAAAAAGVRRIVYVSHTQPSTSCGIPYIEAKASAEEYIRRKSEQTPGLTYAFVRPNCLFGDSAGESIVVNNTCYLMRRLPVMLFPGGADRAFFQPVHVRDLAEMAVRVGLDTDENTHVDAVGPEKLRFPDFIDVLKAGIGARTLSLAVPWLTPRVVYQMTRPLNWWLDDVYVDEGDLQILGKNIACSPLDKSPSNSGSWGDQASWGKLRLSDWVRENGHELGKEYINSFSRYYDKEPSGKTA